ncbi:Hsp20/alpha crystallin family protein [Virgibacillus sp. 6R]|uniref:Hsp20/alpha crystallin family protein n=1 Tax=Metabacillus sp. 22489 TaxID=3453928 RepID=UPI0011A59BDB
MSLHPYVPLHRFANLRKDFDHFFQDFPSIIGDEQSFGGIKVDVHETETEVVAICDIPGLEKKEDVDIQIEQSTLKISGSINRTNEVKEEKMYRKERYVGNFHRQIPLPSPISEEGVKASYKNGVLEVRMPKLQKESKRRIDVEFH